MLAESTEVGAAIAGGICAGMLVLLETTKFLVGRVRNGRSNMGERFARCEAGIQANAVAMKRIEKQIEAIFAKLDRIAERRSYGPMNDDH